MTYMNRPRILILIDWFLPGYRAGGPIQSVANLVRALRSEYDFTIITTDTDHASEQPYPGVRSDYWNDWEGIPVYYFSKRDLTYDHLLSLIRETPCDFVYLNSMYSLPFTIWPLMMLWRGQWQGKMVLAPRGMLQAGAIRLKWLKKRVFLTLIRLSGVGKQIIWHATDEQERQDIGKYFGPKTDIRLSSNIPNQPVPRLTVPEKAPGAVRFVFISRVSRKKNLEFFLERLAEVTEGEVLFDVYGAREDEAYWTYCQALIYALPKRIQVHLKGDIPSVQIQSTLASYHFSVLTTHGENFGHAIFDALAAGKPVIISDRTPWRDLEARNIGWDIPLDELNRYREVIRQCIAMDQQAYTAMSEATWQFARNYGSNPELLAQKRTLFS
ncbi:MAG: glycosyltransferase [Bacteroidetes bacterium]|nr:MAG: glycosyltransferase [Bacteroidota bacterium]